MDFTSSIIGTLDANKVPVNLRSVPVVGLFVCLPRGEMKGACDFLVKQDVAHRFEDVRVESQGEFADKSSPGVGIQNLLELASVVIG